MRRSDVFPSKFMGKDDIGPGLTLTIGQVVQEGVESDGDMKQKAVMYFEEHDAKPWIINAGNWMTIEDAYGEESDDWFGKPIELYVDPSVMFGGKRVGGVRVRIPRGGTRPAARPAADQPKPMTATVKIEKVDISNGWYGITTDAGVFVTNDMSIGQDVQSLGNVAAQFTYSLTAGGKQILTKAVLAEPVHVPVDEDDIPF